MELIDLSRIRFGDDGEPFNEAVVQVLVEEIRKGRSILMPVLMKRKDGCYAIVDGRNRIEAAKRLGETRIRAYVVEEMDHDKLLEVRSGLNSLSRNN